MIVTTRAFDELLAAAAAQAAAPPAGGSLVTSPALGGFLVAAGGATVPIGAGPFSVACWFKPDVGLTPTISYPLVSVWDASAAARSWMLLLSNDTVNFRVSVDGSASFALGDTINAPPAAGQWHLAIASFVGGVSAKLWLDGVPGDVSPSPPASGFASGVPLRVGANIGTAGPQVFSGGLAGAMLWNVGFTDAAAALLWNGGHFAPPSAWAGGVPQPPRNFWALSEAPPGPWVDLGSAAVQLGAVGTVQAGPPPP